MRPGPKPDHSRDAVILDAALEVLAEAGYTGMTVDMVAARAKAGKATVYRRWDSKAQLVLDAIARLDLARPPADQLPDTGSLAGDFRALTVSFGTEDEARRLRVMAGLVSMLADDEGLADRANAAVVEPWVEVNRVLLRRAIARHEISSTTDVETLAWVVPAMATYRVCVQRKPIQTGYVAGLIDTVLLPAVGLTATDPG